MRERIGLAPILPSKGVKGCLTHAVVLGHVVHCLMPTFEGASQGCLRMAAATAPLRVEALKTWVLSMTDGIVEIELGSKVPLAVICVQPPDVIHVRCEKCLVGGHVRRTAV